MGVGDSGAVGWDSRRRDVLIFFLSLRTAGAFISVFLLCCCKNGGRAPRWAFCCPSPSVFDSSCYSVVCMLYTFSARRFRASRRIEIEPTKLKSVVVVVVSSCYRSSRDSSPVEVTTYITVCGIVVVVVVIIIIIIIITPVISYACNRVRFFFTNRKKVLESPRRLLVSSSPPSEVVVVPVAVVVRIVIVHSAVHSKLWVPFND